MKKELIDAEPLDKMLGLQGHSLLQCYVNNLTDGRLISVSYFHSGLGWLQRKGIAMGTTTLTSKHYTDDSGVEHLDIENHLTGWHTGHPRRTHFSWRRNEAQRYAFRSSALLCKAKGTG
jgi:hypothetical protein